MPPKKPAKTLNSGSGANAQSTSLVPRAPRDVTAKASHDYRRDTETGVLKSTHLALTLRNGKHGSRGTGELASSKKISGREKLDYLGEYRTADAEGALVVTFDMEKCLNIAQSQFNSYVDDIIDLKDRNYFNAEVHNELIARYSRHAEDLMNDKNTVTAAIGARIHNTYMLASMWRMIKNGLSNLDSEGLSSSKIRQQLQQNEGMRIEYMMLYDAVNTLVDVAHDKFSSLATSADHFSQYFRRVSDDSDEMAFDWSGLKNSYKSYVDSIVIELCLPGSTFPKHVLTALLKEAIDEVPKDAKRFPQALWDALGDLSVAIQLQFIMEAPLAGTDGERWKKIPRDMPDEFKDWLEAQDKSEAVMEALHGNVDFIVPVEVTKKQAVVDKFWRQVDAICKDKTEAPTLLELWQLDGELDRTPRWTTKAPETRALVPVRGAKGSGKKSTKKKNNGRAAIDNNPYNSDSGSMPSLETVSDSSMESDDEDDVFETSSSEDDDRSDWSGDEDYDTDLEEEFTALQREMRQFAEEYPDLLDPRKKMDEDKLVAERKDNAFLSLLGKLKGRFVRPNQTLKTTPGARPASRVPPSARAPTGPAKAPAAAAATGAPKDRTVTVEEVEDEEVTEQAAKKKKKKPKKKKKSAAAANGEAQQAQSAQAPASPSPPPAPAPAPASPASPKSPTSPKKKAVPSKPATSQGNGSAASTAYQPYMSTTSIDLTPQQSAQSAHAYRQNQGSVEPKNKTKSRPNHGNLAPISEKKGFFSRFGKKKEEQPKPAEVQEEKKSMGQWFAKLNRKTNTYMHQLLHTSHDEKKGIASMKWEHFVQMMLDMGFTYDGSTAGSSVRFDPPPGTEVRSISFHKPHPDPTIHPVMLKKFSKKLQEYYGWSEDVFMEHSNSKL
ncbi:hypothetical protein EWM64_g3543 [Hericium alpestre]|uniref:Uncharacterized protein n=1 Tax=Hericium alpestre TaxID=135208 RepID=A0A4Z0A3M7_9AGAM|nr:hypothetical protein EWM64_g3543 [Hericium alpestre]